MSDAGASIPPTQRCPKCGETKPRVAFSASSSTRTGLQTYCKACRTADARERKDALRAYGIEYRKRNAERLKERQRQRYLADPAKYIERACQARRANPDRARRYTNESRVSWKGRVYAALGNACACCGETIVEFLSIDHVGGWGREHRRRTSPGQGLFVDILRGLESGEYAGRIRLLCMNCNHAIGRRNTGGICPHDLERMGSSPQQGTDAGEDA